MVGSGVGAGVGWSGVWGSAGVVVGGLEGEGRGVMEHDIARDSL